MNETMERVAFLGGYLPRLCGIATFTTDLCEAVAGVAPGLDCFTGAMNDRIEGYAYPSRVHFEVFQKDLDSYRRAADFLNFSNASVLCVQHEFGIHGGPAGSHLLSLLREVRMPVVTTLHTILREPNDEQREVMRELIERSDRLVVMARKGAELLRDIYHAPDGKVKIIPHGIPDMPFADSAFYKEQFGVLGRKVLFTFGLLGPGKGIEQAILALPEIVERHPSVVYLILGATHPHLLAREGERYRLGLERLAEELGVKENVIFYNRFVSLEDLKEFIGATDIYLTPYLAEAQITSGTLAYVFGAGKAVVSTPYWHAQELLAEDRGTLVPFNDPGAIAAGVCAYLDDPERFQVTRTRAYAMGRDMLWPAVGQQYLEVFRQVGQARSAASRTAFAHWTLASRPNELPPLRLDHVLRLSDSAGVLRQATFNVPDFQQGYGTDDNARAYILCNLLDELGGQPPCEDLDRLATCYLAFLAAAQDPASGRFHEGLSYDRHWLEGEGQDPTQARTLWALGVGSHRSRNPGHRKLASTLFERGLAQVDSLGSPQAWGLALLAMHEFLRANPDRPKVAEARAMLVARLKAQWQAHASEAWPWFEASPTADHARLPQALLRASVAMDDPQAREVGLKALGWLASVQTTSKGHFRPMGRGGQGQDGAGSDQRPVEAQAMVSACLTALRITRDPAWSKEAKRAFEWFLGRNDVNLPIYDSGSGGCADGLCRGRVSDNQGAEATLAFHLARAEMSFAEHQLPAGV